MRRLTSKLLVGSFLVFILLPSVISIRFVEAGSATKIKVGPNIDVSNLPGPQTETAVAVNPNNPSQILAGSMDESIDFHHSKMIAYFSSDGGATWGQTFLPVPPSIGNSSAVQSVDPSITWDSSGNVYFAHFVAFYTRASGSPTSTEIAVDRSSDGGRTWASTYFAEVSPGGLFNHKPVIAIDTNPGSPFLGNIYVTWMATEGLVCPPCHIFLSRSTDHGATFSSPVSPAGQVPPVDPTFWAPDVFVGPEGNMYVAWADTKRGVMAVSSSTDGGVSFGSAETIGLSPSAGDVGIPSEPFTGAAVYPTCGADTSSGPNRGSIYCAWIDQTSTNGLDIFEASSADHGQTWSQRVRVNDDPTGVANDQFAPWLSVNPSDGSVNIDWYDTRNDPTHVSTDLFYSRSTDGGLTFSPNIQVTTAPTNEACCGGTGRIDFVGIAAFGGVVHVAWTDRRASVISLGLAEEVFTSTITLSSTTKLDQIPTPLTPNVILLATLLVSAALTLIKRRQAWYC